MKFNWFFFLVFFIYLFWFLFTFHSPTITDTICSWSFYFPYTKIHIYTHIHICEQATFQPRAIKCIELSMKFNNLNGIKRSTTDKNVTRVHLCVKCHILYATIMHIVLNECVNWYFECEIKMLHRCEIKQKLLLMWWKMKQKQNA